MHLRIVAVGSRQPAWVSTAFEEYARRLPTNWQFAIDEIPVSRRGGSAGAEEEGRRLLSSLSHGERLVALDESGGQTSSRGLGRWLGQWQQDGRDVCFAIGGPEGLSGDCHTRADKLWSLSKLTLPHGLVRVLLVEQLYRAWSLQAGHPYHRG